MISSPVTRFLPLESVGAVPYLGFLAEHGLVEGNEEWEWEPDWNEAGAHKYHVVMLLETDDDEEPIDYIVSLTNDPTIAEQEGRPMLEAFQMSIPSDNLHDLIYYAKNSIFGEMVWIADYLADSFGWRKADTLWFILTGKPPALHPITAHTEVNQSWAHDWGAITITVQPWISAGSVAQTYRNLQRAMMGSESKSYVYRSPVSSRKAALFRFVAQQLRLVTEEEGAARGASQWAPADPEHLTVKRAYVGRPPDRELIDGWNEEHPKPAGQGRMAKGDEPGRIDYAYHFRRDYWSTWKHLVRPYYEC